ncbi:50S ribosomal protein L24, chloroplastic [Hondaea fermentalgiana]|uniref:50S ribosomal protein L24, chloroplastic n=1 Tax=Hondaea fermentalgiana TaxID=2315210 RepID=A0A2R5GUM3_9STRA|nr:50S ribosomal protein L24, chloroplastic [Hondaea fermentalgiana]|eukprot:GBG32363.1 50S ribosomal protein L24, chloroplastic [Hondaea fermentalgiana]
MPRSTNVSPSKVHPIPSPHPRYAIRIPLLHLSLLHLPNHHLTRGIARTAAPKWQSPEEKRAARLEREELSRLRKKKIKANQKKPKAEILKQKRKWRIVVGDMVVVRDGLERGKTGRVIKLLKNDEAVIVENVNIRRQERLDEATLDTIETHDPAPISYSNVSHVDPKTGMPTRVRFGFLADGSKVRVSVRSGEIIPYPPREAPDTREFEGDTPSDNVLKRTYVESE